MSIPAFRSIGKVLQIFSLFVHFSMIRLLIAQKLG